MMKPRWLFTVHWALGLTAGLVLIVMGVSGAAIAFKDELVILSGPGITSVEPRASTQLTPGQLERRAHAQFPNHDLVRMTLASEPGRTVEMRLVPAADPNEEKDVWFDPYDGCALGTPWALAPLEFLTELHRFLAIPGRGDGLGRQITGAASIALIFFALSGLYLRWPRRAGDWRGWLTIDRRLSGRNLWRALHAVIGAWMVVFYLFAALTGLWWSYDWYERGMRTALTGSAVERSQPVVGPPDAAAATSVAAAWRGFIAIADPVDYDAIQIDRPDPGEGAGVELRARIAGGRHDRAADYFTMDGRDGTVLLSDLYATRPLGEDLSNSMLELHEGSYFGLIGRILMLIAAVLLLFFGISGFVMYAKRRRRLAESTPALAIAGTGEGTLVAYASQTGNAERIARATAAAFPGAGLISLERLTDEALARTRRLLLVASTYGDAEPPDHARLFERRALASAPAANGVDYAVLALGDREYDGFCEFGHRLDRWMHEGGGNQLFAPVELDGADPEGQRRWAERLAGIGGEVARPEDRPFHDMRIAERECLNPDSAGGPVYRIALEPVGARLHWLPGDIAEILPPASEGNEQKPRDYSIASLASSGGIELIVRLVEKADGAMGLASGHLATHDVHGGPVRVRLRENRTFHGPKDADTPLILIGNGTGLAGLLAHIRERASALGTGRKRGPVWLLFGERNEASDAFLSHELQRHLASGVVERLDRSWSRDPGGPRYVQEMITAQADDVAVWLQRGATIMVCGSAHGMAEGVDGALRDIVGDRPLDELAAKRRYVRDVY